MKQRTNLILIGLLFLLGALSGGAPANAQPATLLGPDLTPQPIALRSFSPDRIEITDAQGNDRALASDDVLRLTFADPTPTRLDDGQALATLRDGQVVIGTLVASGDNEAIRLALSAGGSVDLSLDDLLSIQLQPGAAVPAVEEDDVLLLATGETLVGFVETISETTIGFVVGDADNAIPIPLERIRALAIANKPEPATPAPGKVRAHLTDGSVMLLGQAAIAEQELIGTMTLGGKPTKVALPMTRVAQLELLSGKYRLSPLLQSPMQLVAGGEVFGVAMPPTPHENGGLGLHAPTTVTFELPRGASRVTMRVALDLGEDVPAARRSLAGCEVVVYDGDEAVGGAELGVDEPEHTLTLPVRGRSLRIELKPGVNGPVLDRVRLSDAEVLVSE